MFHHNLIYILVLRWYLVSRARPTNSAAPRLSSAQLHSKLHIWYGKDSERRWRSQWYHVNPWSRWPQIARGVARGCPKYLWYLVFSTKYPNRGKEQRKQSNAPRPHHMPAPVLSLRALDGDPSSCGRRFSLAQEKQRCARLNPCDVPLRLGVIMGGGTYW